MESYINIAYYKETDWEKLLAYIDDREKMHDTWKDWYQSYIKLKKFLNSKGYKVNKIVVDLDELQRYCLLKGIKNDGAARSEFVRLK